MSPAPRPTDSPSASSKRVLLVDDNVDAVESMEILLQAFGYEVATAVHPELALDQLESFAPAAAVIDIGLPGMDGYALARALRAAGLVGASLIAVTGYGREEDVRRSAAHGFDHHLVKPVDLAGLQRLAVLRGQPKEPPGLPAEPWRGTLSVFQLPPERCLARKTICPACCA